MKRLSWIGIAGTTNANASFSAHHNQFIFSIQVFKWWREVIVRSSILCRSPPGDEAGQKSRWFQFLSSLFPRQRRKTTHSSSSAILGKLFCSLREMLNYFKRQLRQFWGPHWGEAGIEREKESGLKTGKSENMLMGVKKFHGAGLVCECVCVYGWSNVVTWPAGCVFLAKRAGDEVEGAVTVQ